jgi:hypothetical protein
MPRRSRIQPHDAAASDREIRRIEDAKSNAKPSGMSAGIGDVRWNQGRSWADLCRSRVMLMDRCPVQTCRPRSVKDSGGLRGSLPGTPLIVPITTFPLFLLGLISRFRDVDGSPFFLSPAARAAVGRSRVSVGELRAYQLGEQRHADPAAKREANPDSFRDLDLPDFFFVYRVVAAQPVVEVGSPWPEGGLTAASRDGVRRRAAANPRGMHGYAADR